MNFKIESWDTMKKVFGSGWDNLSTYYWLIVNVCDQQFYQIPLLRFLKWAASKRNAWPTHKYFDSS